jgi:PIN domain nuclease of toxin-antitoxin system
LIFWADAPERLTVRAKEVIEQALEQKELACSDISFWEIAMLFRFGRLRNDVSAEQYMDDIILTMGLQVLPITPEIALLSQQDFFVHKDPADRLIASTAIAHRASLVSADAKLKKVKLLDIIW